MSNPDIANITAPAPLRDLAGWLCWKREWDATARQGAGAWRKVPYWANGGKRIGRHGRPDDRRQLTTFEIAKAAALRRGFDGVGFATLDTWGICAVDFDDCVSGGRVRADVLAAVEGTYAELSPSSTGVRAFVHGAFGNRKDLGEPFGVEVFSTAGFVTVTGNALPVVDLLDLRDTITDAPPALRALIAQRFGREDQPEANEADAQPIGLAEAQIREALDVLDPAMRHDPWLKVGMAIHHETSGEGFHLWDEWSSTAASYPGSQVLKARWDSFGRGGQRPVTAHALVRMANENGAHIDLLANAADDFDVVEAPAAAPAAGKPERFKVLTTDEFLQRPRPVWVIKGVLPKADVAMLYGEPGAGKSFVALDMFAAIARGVPWRGLKVRQQRVVIVAAEGVAGFRNRVEAYERHNDAKAGIGIIDGAPNLMLHQDAVEVAKAIAAFGGADIVVIDTLAQATPGANENSGEDMGKALAHCRGIGRALRGALVVLIHHTGKDASRGARGWSGLKGAADTEIEIIKTPGGRAMRTSKQKDGKDDAQWGFDLVEVPIGVDEDGEVITSCVVAEAAVPVIGRSAAGVKRGKWEQHVEAAIAEIAVAQNAGIEVKAVIDLAVSKEPAGEGRDTRRQHATRALKKLLNEDDSPYFVDEDGSTFSVG